MGPSKDGDGTDAELVEATLAGDMRAFASLYRRHVAGVTLLCRRRLRAAEPAQDVTQEAFAVALRGLEGLRDREGFGPWVRTIAANLCVKEQARAVPSVPLVIDLRDDESDSPQQVIERREAILGVREAMERLSPADRELLRLRDLDGLPMAAVAAHRGVTHGSAEVAASRARKRLRAVCERLELRPLGLVGVWRGLVARADRSELSATLRIATALPVVLVAASVLGTIELPSPREAAPRDSAMEADVDGTASQRVLASPAAVRRSVAVDRANGRDAAGGVAERQGSTAASPPLRVPTVTLADRPPVDEPETFAVTASVAVAGERYETGAAGGAPAGPEEACEAGAHDDHVSSDAAGAGVRLDVRTSPCWGT